MRHIRAAGTRDQRSTAPAADWRDQAACRNQDTDLWFDDTEAGVERAKRACDGCPVLVPCREYALTRPERYGVFGGMSADERKKERHNRSQRVSETPRPVAAPTKKTPKKPQRVMVDATGTMRRLQALAVRGIGSKAVGQHTTYGGHRYLWRVRNGELKEIDARAAAAVAAAYRRLAALPPSPYGGQAIALARESGWLGPESWVGSDIDDPAAGPAVSVRTPERPRSSAPRVPAVGCMRRLQAAAFVGIPLTVIARESGLSVSFLTKIRSGLVRTVQVPTAGALREALLRVSAPESPSASAVGTAVTSGWLPLEAWAGVDIDDPDARPRQTTAA